MRLAEGWGWLLVLAPAAAAQSPGGVFCMAEIDVFEESPEQLTAQDVWAKTAAIPGFKEDTGYLPVLMEPSPFKTAPLGPLNHSYLVRGTMSASDPAAGQEQTAAQMGDDCGVLGLLKLCPQSGPNPFIAVQINQALADCDLPVQITLDPIMVPPEPDQAVGPAEEGGCGPPWTPTCGGTCPFGDDCAGYPWEPGDPCDEQASIAEARALQGVDRIHCLGLRGQDMRIGIVDGGIDDGPGGLSDKIRAFDAGGALFGLGASEKVVIGGWPTAGPNMWGTPFPGLGGFSPWGDHAPMTASNALTMAPKARLYDIRITAPCPSDFCPVSGCGRLSNALAGFDWAIRLPAGQRPQVLSNSWGIFREEDAPDYSVNRSHWFQRKVDEAVAAGITVVFAAGNTGPDHIFCPPCAGSPPVGMPGPILGANGHPDVITVGAVNKHDEYVAYSTPGGDGASPTPAPGVFDGSDDAYKPDVLGPCHLNAYWGGIRAPVSGISSDAGTSTACASVAGQIALLRQARPAATAAQVESALKSTALRLGAPDVTTLPWGDYNYYTGFGRLQAHEALRELVVHCPDALDSPIATISLSTGGTQPLGLCAGPAHAGKLYLMLGSTKICPPGSTTCGFPTPVGNSPLDFSSYYFFTLANPNSVLIPKSVDFLDADGTAVSSFTLPPLPLSTSLIDATLYHAYSVVTLQDPFTAQFLSDVQAVLLTP